MGEKLTDARGVSRLVSRRIGIWPLVAVMLAGTLAIAVAVASSPALRNVIELLVHRLRDVLGV